MKWRIWKSIILRAKIEITKKISIKVANRCKDSNVDKYQVKDRDTKVTIKDKI